jgi:hypothetical protein
MVDESHEQRVLRGLLVPALRPLSIDTQLLLLARFS